MEEMQFKYPAIIQIIGADRAALATCRSLNAAKVPYHLAFQNDTFFLKYVFSKFIQGKYFFYDSSNENKYIMSLILIKESIGKFILIPNGEQLTYWAIKNKEVLEKNGILLPTVDYEKFKLVSSKGSFAKLCNRYDIPTPKLIDINLKSFENKFVIKPYSPETANESLKMPFLVENSNGFKIIMNKNLNLNNYLIQEYIYGPSIYYCAIWHDSREICHFGQINIIQNPNGGSVIKSAPYTIPINILTKIREMLESINWHGIIMIELKFDIERSEYFAIEANARIYGPMQLSIDNGVNLPLSLVNKKCEVENVKSSRGYVWYGGLLIGVLKKISGTGNFQVFNNIKTKNIKYYDVWFRKDTCHYFFLEPFHRFFLKNWKLINHLNTWVLGRNPRI